MSARCSTSGGFLPLIVLLFFLLPLFATIHDYFYAVQMQSLLSVVTSTGRYVTLRPSNIPPASVALPYSRTHTGLVRYISRTYLAKDKTLHIFPS